MPDDGPNPLQSRLERYRSHLLANVTPAASGPERSAEALAVRAQPADGVLTF
jgi:hypothetical protein